MQQQESVKHYPIYPPSNIASDYKVPQTIRYVEQKVEKHPEPTHTSFEWWQFIFLPIILGTYGVLSVWLKVRAKNDAARKAAPTVDDYPGDETIMNFVKDEITKRRDK